MTKIKPSMKNCSVCNHSKEAIIVALTHTMGFSDLDTRPRLARNTISEWIERCPSCGYCAPNIELPLEKPEILKSKEYLFQLNNKAFPELSRSFLCWSIIQENMDNFAKAAWASIHAAWAADDKKNENIAKLCRTRAVALIKKLKEKGESFSDQDEDLILVDLLRRIGEFEEALKIYNDALKKDINKEMKDLLEFELKLIKNKDEACHKTSEVIHE